MFQVKDKTGQEIFLKDKVKYTGAIDEMGLTGEQDGLVIAMPNDITVQVQPLGGGVPVICDSNTVLVTDSLVQRVASLANHDELQQLIHDAEERHASEVAKGKKPRKKAGAKRAPVKVEEATVVEVDIEI